MKVILVNGTELNSIMVMGSRKTIQGASRDTLTFIFPASESITELDGHFTSQNCESIRLVGDDGQECIHHGYTIRDELSKKLVEVVPETESDEAVYENRIFVSMAQRTYMESQLFATQEAVEMLCLPDAE